MTDRIKALADIISRQGLSRRTFMVGTGAALGATALSGALSSAFAADEFKGKTVTFASWGGAYQDAQKICYCEPFAAKTGATVVQDGPVNEAKFRTMVEAGDSVWDVVDVTHEFLYSGIKSGLFEKLDASKIHMDRINPAYRTDYGVGDIVWSYNIGYSTKAFKEGEHPKSWADIFDLEKFPGSRTLNGDGPSAVFEAAVMADGVPMDQVYKVLATEEGVKRALAKLDTIRDKTIFWETNSQSQQLFTDGEVTCGLILNGRAYDAAKKGAAIAIEWNQNIQSIDYLVIPKGAKNVEVAMGLIDEMTVAENQAKLANMIAYSPTNPEAFKDIDPAIAPWLSTSKENAAKGFVIDAVFWQDHLEKYTTIWEEWKLG
ncbi:putative spermidine/putrescine transport system substrate-binding protein [Rhodoligotrophos appendicifer]|uniref:extracellular solute-binding protein n=1 Tax=Rhodoligotrophos appendicifer TaxID=987056 RepID=UPI0011800552|nr:extracellular solute-binding protein [Rhodoligotrophos appendicifer]